MTDRSSASLASNYESACGAGIDPDTILEWGREIVRVEAAALADLTERLSTEFVTAIRLIAECRGSVIVTGMGKAGLVGQKLAATFASTGTRSHFLHAGEAVHGDLGRIHRDDLVLVLSASGETEEIVRLLPSLQDLGTHVLAITGQPNSRLGQAATITLDLGSLREACVLGLAPSTSTTAMLALGDALALVVSRVRGFGRGDFARFHPGGSLGRKLAKVNEVMRPLADCRVAAETATVRDILVQVRRPGRRTGAIMLLDPQGRLTGIFTDSDLARLLERKQDAAIDGPIHQVMTRNPRTIPSGAAVSEAITLLADRKLSELPVIAADGTPAGLIDVTDLMSWFPQPSEPESQSDGPHILPLTLSARQREN
ncbi:MAG: SIS domain-containing protein [Planctomycetota bacterium]